MAEPSLIFSTCSPDVWISPSCNACSTASAPSSPLATNAAIALDLRVVLAEREIADLLRSDRLRIRGDEHQGEGRRQHARGECDERVRWIGSWLVVNTCKRKRNGGSR